jgi:hypothetical protein
VTISDGSDDAGGVFDEIEFVHFVTMSGVLEEGLMPFSDIEDVEWFESCNFGKTFSHKKCHFVQSGAKLRKKIGICKQKMIFLAKNA